VTSKAVRNDLDVLGVRPWFAGILSIASGVAGLAYELIWTEQLGLALGHEYGAVLGVLTAFFGGIGLGSAVVARVLARSTQPLRWYIACELVIALWAFVLSYALMPTAQWIAMWLGPAPSGLWHAALAFVGAGVLLLPACCAMGGTLPALERALSRGQPERKLIGALYATNTWGAVLGVLATTFVFVPRLGLSQSARACAAINALCALVAVIELWRRPSQPSDTAPPVTVEGHGAGARSTLLLLGAIGVLGIGYEVSVVRVLSQYSEDTVYTFAWLLAMYLLGTGAGGAIYQRQLSKTAIRHADWTGYGLLGAAAACALGAGTLWFVRPLKETARALLTPALGELGAAVGAEACSAAAAFLPPTAAMGALFSHACEQARARGADFASALASNTAGAALAPLLFGIWLIPAFGTKVLLLSIALGYLSLSAANGLRAQSLGLAGCTALAWWFAPGAMVVDVPPGGTLVDYAEGMSAAVSVVRDAQGISTLHIDNRQQEGSDATLLSDARQAWLPLLLHPEPKRALFLGLGTGLTAGSAAWDPALYVEAVELSPEVEHATRYFSDVLQSERRPRVIVGDARRFVRAAGFNYDVIISDLFHPARSGAGALYSVEHFQAVERRLEAGGLFCQWLPLHQLDLESLRSIVRSFLTVYPNGAAILATHSVETPVLGLVAQRGARGYRSADVRARIERLMQTARLPALHLEDEYAVLGSFIADAEALASFADGAALNTDDHPVVAHRAPLLTYASTQTPRERLLHLLGAVSVHADAISLDPPEQRARLTAYWSARTHYLEVGARVQPNPDVRAMLSQVGAALLSIVQQSPDFRPAYDPLLNMAQAILPVDSARAIALLTQLSEVQPARHEAAEFLQRIRAMLPRQE